ncbi:glycosyltransferase family 4 protein [Myroides albus]|uniref:glycosyltransferase family 4 protein n=1 Tax=Myroides albus TaxID=2562892 RepID=UPI002159316F|nr:glycosyltransferase family 4 protein [Myroides albus]UVD79134.1 glycosyltransferase family 4 protein [Myroides albus]
MNILHIANDYSGSKVYQNLIKNLDYLDLNQIIYTGIRDASLIDCNKIIFCSSKSRIIYRNILTKYDRINFYHKVKKLNNDLKKLVDLSKIDLIHAHTWYSDGAVAYELFKDCNIPYVITIRNTDMNLFYKFMLHLRKYGEQILQNARKIIFISDVYKERFLETSVYKRNYQSFNDKITIKYNGIDKYWISNSNQRMIYSSNNIFKILYIGKFDKGKNVLNLIKAIKRLNIERNQFSLTLIGGGGNDERKVLESIIGCKFINFLGVIYDKEKLKEKFREHHLFAMPSHAETFGLVYLEAISQGLPILNTVNEGIYGIYNNVGESVVSTSIDSISAGIKTLRENYNSYDFVPFEIVSNHLWEYIAKDYKGMYECVLQ